MMQGLSLAALFALATPAPFPSTPDLGKADARCRAGENGPAFLVDVAGLKDRSGRLKLEVYPANDADFLADDNILIAQGKTFRRIEQPVPPQGGVTLCVRVPSPGRYAVMLLHDRDANRKFGVSIDGVGFGGNPKLGLGKPRAAAAAIPAGNGPARQRIVLNYRQGLLAFGPISARR